ncbi:MAG TPA: tripartite tricarboxylate transporter substrate-binding protein [Gemmatimonadales bacterium]|nr:tripartite tricarboxylate transporter substrate-binding protein [Gemmatimonadales bacterium]
MRPPMAALVAALSLTAPVLASAQGEPRDLTIAAPAAPGGGWDQTARVMQQVLRATGLARSVQVVNAPGAAGTIGLARFVSAETGNGDALLVTGLVMVSGIAANRSPVTLADVTPIARLSGEYEVIVVPASSPYRSLAHLLAAFRANPGAVAWGGGSAGGTDEILVRLLAQRVGVEPARVNYVAYPGGGQALASVLGAHVSAAVSGLGEFAAHIESGGLRALAVSAPNRVPGVSIPTFREQGVELELLNWRGLVGPPGLSRAERRELEDLVRRMATSDEWTAALERNGWADIYMEGEPFGRFLIDETARVAPLVASRAGRGGWDSFELAVLLGGGIALAAAAWRVRSERRRARGEPAREDSPVRVNLAALGVLALALATDLLLIESAGFVIASTLMFALTAHAFGSRHPARDALIGLALAALVYAGFTCGLGIALPGSVLG